MLLQAYADELAAKKEAAAAAKQGGGGGGLPAGVKLEDPSALEQPGTSHGKIKVVREGGTAMAYSWDAAK